MSAIEYRPMETLRWGDRVHLRVLGERDGRAVFAAVALDAMDYDIRCEIDGFLAWEEESLRHCVRTHLDEC